MNILGLKSLEFTLMRTIPAKPSEIFGLWLDPTQAGNPWHKMKGMIFNPKVGGLFYRMHPSDDGKQELAHYGRFTILKRANKIQYTWVSQHTRGIESIVTLTLQAKGDETIVNLKHENLPDDEFGRLHKNGWNFYLGQLSKAVTEKLKKVRIKRGLS